MSAATLRLLPALLQVSLLLELLLLLRRHPCCCAALLLCASLVSERSGLVAAAVGKSNTHTWHNKMLVTLQNQRGALLMTDAMLIEEICDVCCCLSPPKIKGI
jgi:hypothetical protein